MPIDIFLKQCMAVSYIITTWATYQCDYINTRKCGNITALGNLQTKRGPLKFPQVFFFYHFWRLRSFFNRPYSWILPALPSPRKSHILNPPMAFSAIIIKSSMYSYTTLYTIYQLRYIPNMTHKSSNYSELGIMLIFLLFIKLCL